MALFVADLIALVLPYLLVRVSTLKGQLHLFKLGADGEPRALLFTFDWYILLMAVVPLYLFFRGHYSQRKIIWEELRDLFQVIWPVAAVDALLLLFSNAPFQFNIFALHWIAVLIALPLTRWCAVALLDRGGFWRRPTVIIGAGENAYQTWIALQDNGHIGREVRLLLRPPGSEVYGPLAEATLRSGVPIVELAEDVSAQLREWQAAAVVIAVEDDSGFDLQALMDTVLKFTQAVDVVPSIRGIPLYGLEARYVFGAEVLLLRARNNLARRSSRVMKRTLDLALAAVLVVALSPLFAWIAWKIYRQSGAPILFGHVRIGRGGRPFKCLKFRTMVPDAQKVLDELLARDPEARAEWERDFKLRNDPRITKIGGFLRRTSLDELPQLFNVLRGEMSLIGPRPIIQDEVERYGRHIQYYYDTTPGISGIWQISGRNDIGYDRRVYLDSWYVKNWSLWYDLLILVLTAKVVFRRSGAY